MVDRTSSCSLSIVSACDNNTVSSEDLLSNRPAVQRFLTTEQANDILSNSKTPVSSSDSIQMFSYIKRTFTGFYPDIEFVYDAEDITPNVYAYEADGRKVVRVSSGLARILQYESLFMAMAFGVSCFYSGEPKNSSGFPTIAAADYYAFGVVLREVVYGATTCLQRYIIPAMQQWKNLFSLVSPENASGDPLLNYPSLSCRLLVIEAAINSALFPECAGGPLVS